MKVLVTGAGGYIGRAVVQELLNNGHEVVGLAHSDANAERVAKAGAEVLRGDIEDLESLKNAAKATDGVIHLAFIHDFSNFEKAVMADRAAIEAMGEALTGTGKPLVNVNGTLGLPLETTATEDTEALKQGVLGGRDVTADKLVAISKEKNVRGILVRLSPTVHGKEDPGFIPILMAKALQNGHAIYVGDGSNRWPAVHRLDAAVLLRLALEKGRPGVTYHAVAEEGLPMKDIIGLLGKHLRISVESKTPSEAAEDLGFFAHLISKDNPVSSEKTRKELGWHPT